MDRGVCSIRAREGAARYYRRLSSGRARMNETYATRSMPALKSRLSLGSSLASRAHADAPGVLALLRARRERPRCDAAEQCDEIAALHLRGHSMTSSASASSVAG